MRRKNKRLAAVLAAVIFSAAAFLSVVGALRPDIRYGVRMALSEVSSGIKVKEVSPSQLEMKEIDLRDFEINDDLILVNKDHPITDQEEFEKSLADYKGTGVLMNERAAADYSAMSKAITDDTGHELWVMSSYRTEQEQQQINEEQGSATAMPSGCSEHQTGLALDLYFTGYAGGSILRCEGGRYLADNCSQYGFKMRYPPAKEGITGIEYEPWHYRYVGLPHSKIITSSGMTLEEYLDSLEEGKYYSYGDYILTRTVSDKVMVPEKSTVEISRDNCGGYIVTSKVN